MGAAVRGNRSQRRNSSLLPAWRRGRPIATIDAKLRAASAAEGITVLPGRGVMGGVAAVIRRMPTCRADPWDPVPWQRSHPLAVVPMADGRARPAPAFSVRKPGESPGAPRWTQPNRWLTMATLFRVGAYRIVVLGNDHPPPHVHAIGPGHARFMLGARPEDVRLVEQFGIGIADLKRIARSVAERHEDCLATWRRNHG